MEALRRQLSMELGQYGIRVVTLSRLIKLGA
jgi:hypothetical protein